MYRLFVVHFFFSKIVPISLILFHKKKNVVGHICKFSTEKLLNMFPFSVRKTAFIYSLFKVFLSSNSIDLLYGNIKFVENEQR